MDVGKRPPDVHEAHAAVIDDDGGGGISRDERVPAPPFRAFDRLQEDARPVAGQGREQPDGGRHVGQQLGPDGDERPGGREPHEPKGGRAPTFFYEGVEHEMDVEALLRPMVERSGLELVDVTLTREPGRRVLRVTVDQDGGVDLETIAQLSEKVSRRLDLEDPVAGRYQLEITSP